MRVLLSSRFCFLLDRQGSHPQGGEAYVLPPRSRLRWSIPHPLPPFRESAFKILFFVPRLCLPVRPPVGKDSALRGYASRTQALRNPHNIYIISPSAPPCVIICGIIYHNMQLVGTSAPPERVRRCAAVSLSASVCLS